MRKKISSIADICDHVKQEGAGCSLNNACRYPECIREQFMDVHSGDVCFDCGPLFLTEEQKKRESAVTAWNGICTVCKQEKSVTNRRHFNYLRIPE